jgi:hypothetical protein
VALNSFGPPVSRHHELYVRLGLKRRTNEDRRAAFRHSAEARIGQLGLAVPRLLRTRYPFL